MSPNELSVKPLMFSIYMNTTIEHKFISFLPSNMFIAFCSEICRAV